MLYSQTIRLFEETSDIKWIVFVFSLSATARIDDVRLSRTGGVFTHLLRAVSFLNTQSGVALLSRYRRRPATPRSRRRGHRIVLFIYLFFSTHVHGMCKNGWRRACAQVCVCVCVCVRARVCGRGAKCQRAAREAWSWIRSAARG